MTRSAPELSVVIPVYNERATVTELIHKVLAVPIRKEVILVDDASRDGSGALLDRLAATFRPDRTNLSLRVIHHPQNQGKGAAIRSGFQIARGAIWIVQDADLEYDPDDYPALLAPIRSGATRVVYGSRRLRAENTARSSTAFYLGGALVTWWTNVLFGSRLTDEPTCYKVFHRSIFSDLTIDHAGFEWEPEITAKLLRRGVTIVEVPIRYYPRSMEEGKKINWRDGVKALWTLLRYRFQRF